MTNHKEFLYKKIYDDLIRGILEGVYSPEKRLPSEKELAGKYGVSRITSKKALELLEENGYVTRMPGRGSFVTGKSPPTDDKVTGDAEQSGKSRLIGMIIEDFAENFGTMIIAGTEQGCRERGYSLVIKRSNGSQKQEGEAIEDLVRLGVEGILIIPVHGDNYNPMILRLAVESFPFVLIDRELKGIPASFVGTDNLTAATGLTDLLFDLGNRHICFVSPSMSDTSTILDRREGFLKSNAEHEVLVDDGSFLYDLSSTLPGQPKSDGIRKDAETVKQYLLKHPETTAFFAVEYNIALIISKAVRELGKRIPEDYAVVCFDSPPNFVEQYAFTHIQQDETEIGLKSVELLFDRMKGGKIEKCYWKGTLVRGESTPKLKK